jgi:DNA-binding IclR family transcriptional regulator
LLLLRGLAKNASDGCTFSELQRQAGHLTAATTSRLLQVLCEEDWVTHQDDGRYRVGPAGVAFAQQLHGGVAAAEQIRAAVAELAHRSGHSAAFTVWAETGFLFVDKEEMPDSYHYLPIGSIGPDVFQNGFGLVTLAHQDSATVTHISRQHAFPLKEARKLLKDVAEAQVYHAHDKGRRLIAPIFSTDGTIFLGCLGISCPPVSYQPEEIATWEHLLLEMASSIHLTH